MRFILILKRTQMDRVITPDYPRTCKADLEMAGENLSRMRVAVG